MSTTQEAVARRLIEVGFNEGNLAVADELIASDMVEHWGVPDRLGALLQLGLSTPSGA